MKWYDDDFVAKILGLRRFSIMSKGNSVRNILSPQLDKFRKMLQKPRKGRFLKVKASKIQIN